MPNRILKETICTSDSINNLSQASEIMWYRLLVNCDDFGTMDARPFILLSKCFPLKVKAISEAMIEKWVQELSANGLIQLYTNDGRRYLYLNKWEKHQQIRAKWAKNPLPVDENSILISDDIKCNQVIANVPVIQSNPNPNPIRNPNPNPSRTREAKKTYADNVTMTETEYQKLVSEHGEQAAAAMVTILDNYKGASGKQYKDDYRAILNWVVKRYQEDQARSPTGAKSPLSVLQTIYEKELVNEQNGNG